MKQIITFLQEQQQVKKWLNGHKRFVKSNIRGFLNIIEIPDYSDMECKVIPYKIHDSLIFCIKQSYKHNGIISGDKNGQIKFSELTINNELKDRATAMNSNHEGVRSVCFSPSEYKLVSCHEDKSICLWDIGRFSEEKVLEGHGSDVMTVDWHPSKSLIVSGGKDRLIKFWDPISHQNIGNLFNHTNTINTITFNRNERFLLSAGKDQIIRITDLRMMKEVFLLSGHNSEVLNVKWHPIYSNHLVSCDIEGKICYWVLPDTLPVDITTHTANNPIPNCDFDQQGDFICSLSHDKSIKIWEIKENQFNQSQSIFVLLVFFLIKNFLSFQFVINECLFRQ